MDNSDSDQTQSNLSKCIIKIKQTVYNSKSLCTILKSDQTNSIPTVSVPDVSMDDTHPVPKLPPPIFIRLVNDFKSFCSTIHSVTNGEDFTCKSSTNGLKLSTSTPTFYRNVIKFLKDSKADFHTYQPKQERVYRIVVRNLHHTTCI